MTVSYVPVIKCSDCMNTALKIRSTPTDGESKANLKYGGQN